MTPEPLGPDEPTRVLEPDEDEDETASRGSPCASPSR